MIKYSPKCFTLSKVERFERIEIIHTRIYLNVRQCPIISGV